MVEELSKKSPEVYIIPDNHVFYIPGKLEQRTTFSKYGLSNTLKNDIQFEDILRKFGFILEGFNEAKFYLNDVTGELRYGNELDVKNALEGGTFHPSKKKELKNFITTEVFKNLKSDEFSQSLKFSIVLPDKIYERERYCSEKQIQGIIKIFKEMKDFIFQYTEGYAKDENEQLKKKFSNKNEVLQQSINALSQIILDAELGHIKDFELLMLTRLLVYQMNKKS